jgi:hypothetical protein
VLRNVNFLRGRFAHQSRAGAGGVFLSYPSTSPSEGHGWSLFGVFDERESCLPASFMLLAARAWCLPMVIPPVYVPAPTHSRLSISSPGTFSLCCFAIHTFSLSPGEGLAPNEVMAGQRRRRSRGSISSLTKDAARSLSRAGSQQGCSNSFQNRAT